MALRCYSLAKSGADVSSPPPRLPNHYYSSSAEGEITICHSARHTHTRTYTHIHACAFTYRRILPAVLMMSVLAEGAASIQLNVELVVVAARPVNVHAIGIVRVACN